MDANNFIVTIGGLTLINNLIVQFIKTQVTNKNTTLIAFATAIVIAFVGLYMDFYNFDIVATVILGLATGLSSTVGYDKIKQCYASVIALR